MINLTLYFNVSEVKNVHSCKSVLCLCLH